MEPATPKLTSAEKREKLRRRRSEKRRTRLQADGSSSGVGRSLREWSCAAVLRV